MFVVIDGIDGSGKGTQIELVKEALEKQGKSVYVLDYPRYGEKSAYFAEKYLNGNYGGILSPKMSSLFFALDRFDSKFEFEPKIDQYDYILSNRYVSASMIHQGGMIQNSHDREEFVSWLQDLEYNICGLPKPDKTILLLVKPDIAKKLIATKTKREYIDSDANIDIYEQDDGHLQNAYDSALQIGLGNGFTILDCTENGEMMSRENVTNSILDLIKK